MSDTAAKRLRRDRARPIKALLSELYGYRLVFNGCYYDRAWVEFYSVTEEIDLTDDFDRTAILDLCDRLAERYEDAAAERAKRGSDSVWWARQGGDTK